MSRAKSTEACLTPECGSAAGTRGLCSSCYQQARTLVREKKVTWDELVELGACLPARQQQPRSAFHRSLAEKRAAAKKKAAVKLTKPVNRINGRRNGQLPKSSKSPKTRTPAGTGR